MASKTYEKLKKRIIESTGYSVEGDEAIEKAIDSAWENDKITDDEYLELSDNIVKKSGLYEKPAKRALIKKYAPSADGGEFPEKPAKQTMKRINPSVHKNNKRKRKTKGSGSQAKW